MTESNPSRKIGAIHNPGPEVKIGSRIVGIDYEPLVIAEIGINHEGDVNKARSMIDDAYAAGCECVKFQCHVIDDEMIPNNVIPGNATESIWNIMDRCKLSEQEDYELKQYAESKGMIYVSTPFSRAAADRLEGMGVSAYKIGSGECNNYPLVEHIARFKKPVILSTGMNDIQSVAVSVAILKHYQVPYVLMHCTSMYPTPYDKVRLGAISEMRRHFPEAVLGLSDHSIGNYACLGSVVLGARILEKHFTSDKTWPGPDISISIDPGELKDLILGSRAIFQSLGGQKRILPEERPTIDFAYACVVTIRPIRKGDTFSEKNIWVKRPGTGSIKAGKFKDVVGQKAARELPVDTQLAWDDIVRDGAVPCE